MSDSNDKRAVAGDSLDMIVSARVACTFKAGDYEYMETFIYDGITLRNLLLEASRKAVIARGQAIGRIPSEIETEKFRDEGPHTLAYDDATKEIVSGAKKMQKARKFWDSLTAEERAMIRGEES